MSDLNMMMREQAQNALNSALDAAVTAGDAEAARKVSADIAKLAVSAAPKAPPYGDVEIKEQIGTLAPWFGVDPKKSGRVLELGKHMDPKKFATAEAFAKALISAVDEEFKPARTAKENEEDEDPEAEEDEDDKGADDKKPKPRKTDSPGENDTGRGTGTARRSGPWAKMSDAPADIQKEIRRQADKFVSANAPKEQREKFINIALASNYAAHQRNKAGKK